MRIIVQVMPFPFNIGGWDHQSEDRRKFAWFSNFPQCRIYAFFWERFQFPEDCLPMSEFNRKSFISNIFITYAESSILNACILRLFIIWYDGLVPLSSRNSPLELINCPWASLCSNQLALRPLVVLDGWYTIWPQSDPPTITENESNML